MPQCLNVESLFGNRDIILQFSPSLLCFPTRHPLKKSCHLHFSFFAFTVVTELRLIGSLAFRNLLFLLTQILPVSYWSTHVSQN